MRSLRRKSVLLVVAAVGALVAGLYVSDRVIVERGFDRAERKDTVAKVEATRAIVTTMAQEFGDRSSDWSNWDETATFLAGTNDAYLEANVTGGSFVAIGWDVFMVVRADGTPVVSVSVDGAGVLGTPPAGLARYLPALLRGAAEHGPPIAGLGVVDGRPMLLSSRAIRNTDGSPGAVAGRLIIGHVIDDEWMARLARFTLLDVEFVPARALEAAAPLDRAAARALGGDDLVHTAVVSEQAIAGWGYLRDLDGRPELLVKVELDRAIHVHGREILRAATIALAIGGAVVLVVVLVLVGRGVLRPLAGLMAAVRGLERGERTRVIVASKDELGQLAGAFNQMAEVIADREASLRAARARTRLVLDSTGDGLVTCTLDGTIDGEVSAAARAWFGEPADGADVASYLAGADLRTAWALRLGLEQLAADLLPFEAAVEQLPRRLQRDGRRYALSFRPIEGVATASLLVVATDVTALANAEAAEAGAREAHEVVAHVLRDPAGFERFVVDTEGLLERSASAPSPVERARALHTLKGNAAIYGMASVAAAAHAVEDRVADGSDPAAARAALLAAWRAALGGAAGHRRREEPLVQLTVAEHVMFMARLERETDHRALVRTARSWRLDPVSRVLERLADHTRRIAVGRSKPVDVVVDSDASRVDVHATAGFWASLVHVIRNAIEHGVDEPEARAAAGKPARGTIRLEARTAGGELQVAIADDGAGIDWDGLVARARERGLIDGDGSREDALFADGVSTRDEVSELSGRGVGLGAVRAACDGLGVRVDVASTPGAGTRFVFTLRGKAGLAAA